MFTKLKGISLVAMVVALGGAAHAQATGAGAGTPGGAAAAATTTVTDPKTSTMTVDVTAVRISDRAVKNATGTLDFDKIAQGATPAKTINLELVGNSAADIKVETIDEGVLKLAGATGVANDLNSLTYTIKAQPVTTPGVTVTATNAIEGADIAKTPTAVASIDAGAALAGMNFDIVLNPDDIKGALPGNYAGSFRFIVTAR